jgi:hypothetical protein
MLILLLLALSPWVKALGIRVYSQTANNRLLSFPGQPIFAQIPTPNPGFSPSSSLFTGIGWPAHPTDWTRQMTLISPRHFIYATHYPLGPDWRIAFLGSDGQQHLYEIESQIPVVDPLGRTTDLMVCTLKTEVAASTGITPFPVLNLPQESDYTGREMVVFGSFVRSGRMPLAGFINLVDDPGFDTTRFAYFDYNHNGGNANDCDYQGGDSGAPTFIMEGGKAAIIGTCSGRDEPGWRILPSNISRNYIGFIPAYLSEMDLLMENHGYHMKRIHPAPTSVAVTVQPSSPLRRKKPGGISIALTNSGTAVAHNISTTLAFPTAPATVGGSGFTCDNATPYQWNCRRGGLGASEQSTLAASWSVLPDSNSITLSLTQSHDGSGNTTLNFSIPILESFSSWIQGAGDLSEQGDPDHDGLCNLLEYAFGGSPSINALTSSGGHLLIPQASTSGNRFLLRFPQRTDAAVRGISTVVEFSSAPSETSWTSNPPDGTTITTAAYSPASPGFEQVTVSMPVSASRRFARVRVTLSE